MAANVFKTQQIWHFRSKIQLFQILIEVTVLRCVLANQEQRYSFVNFMPNLCQIKKSLRLNLLVQTIVKSRARILQYIVYQYNLQPKTVKYIIHIQRSQAESKFNIRGGFGRNFGYI